MNTVKHLTPLFYLVALIAFFLPFIEISCSSTSLGTFSGYSMMMGSASESIHKVVAQ